MDPSAAYCSSHGAAWRRAAGLAGGWASSLAPSMDRPNATGFSPSGGSRMPGTEAAREREGKAGTTFPASVGCLPPPCVLDQSVWLQRAERRVSLLCFQKPRECGTDEVCSPCSCPAAATVPRWCPLPTPTEARSGCQSLWEAPRVKCPSHTHWAPLSWSHDSCQRLAFLGIIPGHKPCAE